MNTPAQRIVLVGADRTAVVLQSVAYRRTVGYAVFAFPMSVGRQWGMGFLCKAMINSLHSCGSVTRRFSHRRGKIAGDEARRVCANPAGVITQMLQAPQTLGEEASKLSKISIAAICASIRVIKSWPR